MGQPLGRAPEACRGRTTARVHCPLSRETVGATIPKRTAMQLDAR